MARDINRPFAHEEVEFALSQMGPLKSPRPNGLGACFDQKHWQVIGGDICAAVMDILHGDGMILSLNSIYIALIPKVCNPTLVTEFCPISLCNMVYKLVSIQSTNK